MKKNFYLKDLVLVLFLNVLVNNKRIILSTHTPITFSTGRCFCNPSLFISSIILEPGIPTLFSRNSSFYLSALILYPCFL